MNISLQELKELLIPINNNSESKSDKPFQIGKAYFFRTVTYHVIGIVEFYQDQFLFLSNASWIADSGRFSNAIKEGTIKEVEPTGEHILNLANIVDAMPWVHALPDVQK